MNTLKTAKRAKLPGWWRRIHRWLTPAIGGCCFFAGLVAGLAQPPLSADYRIEATCLCNFAKFVEWPGQTITNRLAPVVIGVFGQNPFGDALQAIAKEHKINGREMVIKPVASAAEAGGVQVLFFGATEDRHVAETLAALKDAPVLSVGEWDQFIAAGGVINFVRDGNRLRFEINVAAAARHRLKISAQLLKLAKSVHKTP